MKKVLSVIVALVLMMSAMSVFTMAESALPFEDVSEKRWSYESILTLFDAGIINGKSDTIFAPADNVTRAEFVKILGGVAGIDPTAFSTKQFTDVKKKAWYAGYVAWAVEAGVTTGMSKDTFAPNANITREQMATMIYRYTLDSGLTLPDTNPIITFKDAADIAPYAKTAVREMQQADIINGIKDNSTGAYSFDPKANATREQAAKMLCVLFNHINATRRAEVFALLHQFIEDNTNATDTAFSKYDCYRTEIESGAAYTMEIELFYDSARDEIGITHLYEDNTSLEVISTICLPRESGKDAYYKFQYKSVDTVLISATGYENVAKLGRGDYEFHFSAISGTHKNDPAAIKTCEDKYLNHIFEAIAYLNDNILPIAAEGFTTRDLGFNA